MQGAEYAFSDLGTGEDSKLSTINMSMEEFYNTAKDADILIYNCSIVEQIYTLDELLDKSPVLKDFKAVKEGNAWCTSRSMFQQTNKMGSIIQEMNAIFSGDKEAQKKMEYLFKLKIKRKNMTLQQNHKISDRWRYLAVFICLIIAFFVLIVWNINSGAVDISFTEIMKIIFTKRAIKQM